MKRWLLAALMFVSTAVQAQYVTLTGQISATNGIPAANHTISFTPSQWFFAAGSSIFVNTSTYCATSVDGSVVGVGNPLQQSVVTPAFTGTLPPANYYVQYTFYTSTGAETLPSPETVAQLTSTGGLTVAAPTQGIPSTATGMRVYIGTASGAETLQGQTVGILPYIQSTPLVVGVAPPSGNSTLCRQVANDAGWPTGTGYTVALIDPSGNTIPGYPMQWQLIGSGTTVNLSQGLPYYHGVVVFPSPILASPFNHNLQSISSPLSMSGYDLLNIGNLTSLSVNGAYSPHPTIQSAVNEAGPSGSVIIPPAYQGTDTFTNPNNVRVDDERPYNPNNSNTYSSSPTTGPMPQTTIKAADYGAVCNQINDDTAAIQSAVNAAARITYYVGTLYMGPAVVELPQGNCTVSSTIVMSDYGSLKGNNTTLTPRDPWVGANTDVVDLTTTYFPTGSTGNHQDGTSQLGRFITGIKFEYNAGIVSHTAIRVFDPTGSSASTPYPAGAQFSGHQMPGVSIHDNIFYAIDTGLVFQDCGECIARDNQFLALRMGIIDSGNNFGLTLDNNVVQQGSWTFSAPGNRTGATIGIFEQLEIRWQCSNTARNCAGGTATQNLIVTPQGLAIVDGNVEAFDDDIVVNNIQGLAISGGGADFGGDGPAAIANPSTIYPTVVLGANLIDVGIHDAYIATNQPNGVGVQIGAPASPGAGSGPTWNDLYIHDVYFANYASSGSGIVFSAGSFPRRGVKLVNNVFGNGQNIAIQINHPVQYSVVSGNYTGDLIGSGALIQLNAAGSTSFLGTKFDNNSVSLAPYPVIVDMAGGGYTLGTNFSPGGFQGTQSSFASGCSITSGAIGNTCGPVTITLPQTFADSTYTINSCGVAGASGPVAATNLTVINQTTINVTEVALSASATGGGTITCSATHQ